MGSHVFARASIAVVLVSMTGLAHAVAEPPLSATDAAAQVAEPPADALSGAARCGDLMKADFAGVIDAPTQLMEAKPIDAADGVPAHCEVRGYVAPTVGFVLRLPIADWNGKFFEEGCGGFCGGYNLDWKNGPFGFSGPLRRGYAHLVFDGGHRVLGTGGAWAYNNLQAQFDFGVRAPHVAALAGKAIVEKFYRAAPAKSYFSGCSSGGQQALSQAQRFPWDFDGIISGAPSPTFSGPMMSYLWAGRALAGKVDQADLKLVRDRAVTQCDMGDGLKDGIIGDPLGCRFDPGVLACRAGQTTGCLTSEKIEAVRKVYAGPTTSKGERVYTGGPMPGSEENWIKDTGLTAYVDGAGKVAPWPKEYFAYIGFMPAPGHGWNEQFDFDRDYKRLRMAESLFGAADNPDLRKFKAAGGKLIMYQGWQDESDIPADAIDYYETAQNTMGGRAATQAFFRLFMVPGMNHCSTGPGAFAIDYLTYLEAWVEKGKAPDKMIGAHIEVEPPARKQLTADRLRNLVFPLDPSVPIAFTRPVYPHPLRAHYLGKGNPDDAGSFGPVETARPK